MSLSGPGSILAGDVATFICVSHNVSGHSTFRWHIILKSELSLTTVRIVCGSVFQPIRLHYPMQSEMEPHTTLPIVSDNALFKTMWSEMIFRAYSHARKNRPHEIWKLAPVEHLNCNNKITFCGILELFDHWKTAEFIMLTWKSYSRWFIGNTELHDHTDTQEIGDKHKSTLR